MPRGADYTSANFAGDSPPEGLFWEKFTTPQTLANDTLTTIAVYEATPNFANVNQAAQFNATSGIYTVTEAGWYAVSGYVQFVANATGYRQVALSGVLGSQRVDNAAGAQTSIVSATGIGFCPVGRQIMVQARQLSTGNLDVSYAALSVVKL